jgi:hypothetical protein
MKFCSWKTKREIGHLEFLGVYGDVIKMESKETRHNARWLQMAQDSNQWLFCVYGTEHSKLKTRGIY